VFFRDIIGQNDIKARLVKSVHEGYVPHAQLFCGAEGVGKLPLALAYAQYLNCENPGSGDSCGVCPSCLKYNHLVHPDLHFVFPVVKKEKREVCGDYLSEWRAQLSISPYFSYDNWLTTIHAENSQGLIYAKESDEIIHKLNLKIYEGRYKVMLVWLPEKLHEVAANKLLKIIEEPTLNTIFLLVSDSPDQILTTIQSRCQRINVRPIDDTDMQQALVQNFQLDETTALEVAHISRGSFVKAMETISTDEEKRFFFHLFVEMMRASYSRNIKKIKVVAEELSRVGREKQKNFLSYCQQMVREYFVSNVHQPELVYMNREEAQFGQKFSPFINERNVIDFMEELELATRHIEQNVNAKMVFYDICLKITLLIKR
jgi:DNA polymerase-3 subunit delta'